MTLLGAAAFKLSPSSPETQYFEEDGSSVFVKTVARGMVVSFEDLVGEAGNGTDVSETGSGSGRGRETWRMRGVMEVPGDVVLPFRSSSVAVYVSLSP